MEAQRLLYAPRIWLAGLAGAALLVLLAFALAPALPDGIDWYEAFRPGTLATLRGQNPYEVVPGYFTPPWTALLLAPAAVLPAEVGRALVFLLALLALTYVARAWGASPAALALLLLSPPVLAELNAGQIDWLAILGFAMPPAAGLFFVAIKPQAGALIALVWALEAWRAGGWRRLARVFAPFVIVTLVTFVLYGFWPATWIDLDPAQRPANVNASHWPNAVPLGAGLLVLAIRQRNRRLAVPASFFLAPHAYIYSLTGTLVAAGHDVWLLAAIVVSMWVIPLLN